MSDDAPALVLHDQPDWHGAAQELINQFASLPDMDDRVRLLDRICVRLDNGLYPALLHILYCIENYGEHTAQEQIVNTLHYALSTGRLPSGKLPAWGSTERIDNSPFGQTRNVGPIEYLCAWYAQPTNLPAMDQGTFLTICSSLLRLVSIDENARDMYCQKLLSDADDPLSGSLSGNTRYGLKNLAQQWQDNHPVDKLAMQFLDSLQDNSSLNQLDSVRPF